VGDGTTTPEPTPETLQLPDDPAEALDVLIYELAGLTVDVRVGTIFSYAQIVAELCGSTPVVGWVDGPAYVVAEARDCADPALMVERDGAQGYRVQLLMSADFAREEANEDDIPRLAGENLCRINSDDQVSWFVPSLMLYAAGVNPLYDLGEIVEVEDYDALIAAIYNGDCQAGAVPDGYFPDKIGADLRAIEDLQDQVLTLPPSVEIPYDIMVYPQTVPLNVRIPLTDVFVQIAADEEYSGVLAEVLDQDRLRRVDREDFDQFRDFMMATGLDFAALGE